MTAPCPLTWYQNFPVGVKVPRARQQPVETQRVGADPFPYVPRILVPGKVVPTAGWSSRHCVKATPAGSIIDVVDHMAAC
jgi:hypothetical protein